MNKEFWNLTDKLVELGCDKYENPITMEEFGEAHSDIEKAELNLEKWTELREKMKEIEKENQRQRRKAQLRQLAHTSSRLIDLNKNHYQTYHQNVNQSLFQVNLFYSYQLIFYKRILHLALIF